MSAKCQPFFLSLNVLMAPVMVYPNMAADHTDWVCSVAWLGQLSKQWHPGDKAYYKYTKAVIINNKKNLLLYNISQSDHDISLQQLCNPNKLITGNLSIHKSY